MTISTEQPADSTALATIRGALPVILAADENDILGKLAARIAAHKPDATTPKGRDEIRSLAMEVRRAKAELDRLGKTLTEGWRKQTAAVNAERNVIEERLDALAVEVRAPLTEFENREKARVAAHEQAIREIEGWADVPAHWTAAEIAARIEELKAHPHLAREWQEFQDRGQAAARNAYNGLVAARVAAQEREAEAARLAQEAQERAEAEALQLAQEQRAREERAAAEATRLAEARAAEQARLAEEAAAAALAAEQRRAREAEARAAAAEERRIAAHRAALAAIPEAESYGATETSAQIGARLDWLLSQNAAAFEEFADDAATILGIEIERTRELLTAAHTREYEAEAARVADQDRREAKAVAAAEERARLAEVARQEAETKRLAAEAAERERNVAHRRRINREARDAIMLAMSKHHPGNAEESQAIAQAVVEAIARGGIPHVKIEY